MESPGRGKGSLLIHTRDYIVHSAGRHVWAGLLESASVEDQEVLGGILLASAWYPIGVLNRLTRRFCASHYSESPEEEMRGLSVYVSDTDLGGVYKRLLRRDAPAFFLERTGSLWSRYFDVGTLTPSPVHRREWRMSLDMPVGADRAPNHFFCGLGWPTWVEVALKLSAVKRPKVEHTECRYDTGGPCCYRVTW